MKKVIFLLLLCIGFSCGKSDDGAPHSITLKRNNCFTKLENGGRICLDSVFNDSRCPKELVCVWEGDALAAFTLTKNDQVSSFILHDNAKFPQDTIIEGIAIKLLKIAPYPIADKLIEPDDYRGEISVFED